MKNIDIKKEIEKVTKRAGDFQVKVVYWIGDGSYHEEGTVISLAVDLYNEDEELIDNNIRLAINDQDLFDSNADHVKALRKEQKTLFAYLSKHFRNVVMEDLTV